LDSGSTVADAPGKTWNPWSERMTLHKTPWRSTTAAAHILLGENKPPFFI
jgi:hypothetical protein